MSRKILVVSGNSYARALEGLGDFTDDVASFMESPKDFALVLFTGGADVSPELYGDTSPKRLCGTNPSRDAEEVKIFKVALEAGIKMTGICRGSQFINVMSGGRMMHDVRNHGGRDHIMVTPSGDEVVVNSYHHQMSIPSDEGHIIGWSKDRISGRYIGRGDEVENYEGVEVEAIYYPHTRCAGAQYHPEMMSPESDGYHWYRTMVADFLDMSREAFDSKYLNLKVQENSA